MGWLGLNIFPSPPFHTRLFTIQTRLSLGQDTLLGILLFISELIHTKIDHDPQRRPPFPSSSYRQQTKTHDSKHRGFFQLQFFKQLSLSHSLSHRIWHDFFFYTQIFTFTFVFLPLLYVVIIGFISSYLHAPSILVLLSPLEFHNFFLKGNVNCNN